jgi:hypothetical protein
MWHVSYSIVRSSVVWLGAISLGACLVWSGCDPVGSDDVPGVDSDDVPARVSAALTGCQASAVVNTDWNSAEQPMLWATIDSVSIRLNLTGCSGSADWGVRYHSDTSPTWIYGHRLMPIDTPTEDTLYHGSLLFLAPDTTYTVELIPLECSKDFIACTPYTASPLALGTVTTRPNAPPPVDCSNSRNPAFATGCIMTYDVSPSGPYKTIMSALSAVSKQIEAWQNWPVDYHVNVAPGTYRETVVIPGICVDGTVPRDPNPDDDVPEFVSCIPGAGVCDCRSITTRFHVPRIIIDSQRSGTTQAIVDGSNAVLGGGAGSTSLVWTNTGVISPAGAALWKLDLAQSPLAISQCKPRIQHTPFGDKLLSACNLLVIDQDDRTPARLYAFSTYDNLADDSEQLLNKEPQTPMRESGSGGFFIGAGPGDASDAFNLFVALPATIPDETTPASLVATNRFHFGERAFGFDLDAHVFGAPEVTIRNFEICYQYTVGIRAAGQYALDNWIQNNTLHDMSNGISLNQGSGGKYTVIEGNSIRGLMHPKWTARDIKWSPTNLNNSGISTGLTTGGHTFRNNVIAYAATGIQVSSNEGSAYIYGYNIDVYGNRIDHTDGNGIETDGFGVNNRFWNNSLDDALDALSAAPTTVGPVWFIGNVVSNYRAHAFKLNRFANESACASMNFAAGWIMAYHNTVVPAPYDANDPFNLYPSSLSVLSTTADQGGLVMRNNILLAHHAGLAYTIGGTPTYRNLQPTVARPPDIDSDAIWSDLLGACKGDNLTPDCLQTAPYQTSLVVWPNRQTDDPSSSGTFKWNTSVDSCEFKDASSTNKDYTTGDTNISPAPYTSAANNTVAAFAASDWNYDAATPTQTGAKHYYLRANDGPSNLGAHVYGTASRMPDPTDENRIAYPTEPHGFDLLATEVSATKTTNDFSALFDAAKGDYTLTTAHKLLNQAALVPGVNDGATSWLGTALWCRADLGAKKRGDGACALLPFPVADESLSGWTGTSSKTTIKTDSTVAALPNYIAIEDTSPYPSSLNYEIDLAGFATDIANGKLLATLTADVRVTSSACTTGRPILQLAFFDANRKTLGGATSSASDKTSWKTVRLANIKVPAGAVTATVRLKTSRNSTTTACAGQFAGFNAVRFSVTH